jgi:DNA-binding FadR family transcriptional regulator
VPTLIREEGFEVRIYTFDHPPPHVHVAKAGAIMRNELATRQVTEIVGAISDRDVQRAERLVARHAAFLKEEWSKLHGNP